ncbi:N-acetylmuramoyl-L-alanine amidase [Bacillus cereus]|uniref:N-acetylmuramoyl-L-alanine amidase n=1 Tax=Bacillus cereus TaxID=1396 RepID=UPI000BF88B38|nr:N-acetylmuramoyl-L-alanine amidase [Bacillus cereus]PER03265.1 N-acetylmuramoyl-L-alanine amidase [Bacillus cereus]PEV57681.1 N-acetylmuramoyl-L-alanine amidase [Bacillus cereus]
MNKIFIDPGHGGKDSGASFNNLVEKDWTLEVSTLIYQKLKNFNVDVKMSRSSDIYVGLLERARQANLWNANIFISLHVNAGGGTGFESYRYLKTDDKTLQMHTIIHQNIMNQISKHGMRDRGMKVENFAVLRQTTMPAILLEAGFCDSSDIEKLNNNAYKQAFSNGLVYALSEIFDLSSDVTNLKFKIGDMVKVLPAATHYATGEKISEFVKNNSYTVVQVKTANRSESKYMYLLKDINSWVLEQDLS